MAFVVLAARRSAVVSATGIENHRLESRQGDGFRTCNAEILS
jgi:hypothetical protein